MELSRSDFAFPRFFTLSLPALIVLSVASVLVVGVLAIENLLRQGLNALRSHSRIDGSLILPPLDIRDF